MRKTSMLIVLLLFAGAICFSQKKSGTVFSEHESIEKTRAVWQAFADGDADKYMSFFADTINVVRNGQTYPARTKEQMAKGIPLWKKNYDQLMVVDDKPAMPDAIEYKEWGTWVQDWLLLTGIHKESGILLRLPIHNAYYFNKEGKIAMMASYFDNDIFDEIDNSAKKIENGKVYISHPYIASVRKLMNAFVARDIVTWESYFSPKASFSNIGMPLDEEFSLEEMKSALQKKYFRDDLKFKLEQQGYPDCIYYAKNDLYVVYSWWIMHTMKDDKKYSFGFMLSHNFDKDGKIVNQIAYTSSNHLDNF